MWRILGGYVGEVPVSRGQTRFRSTRSVTALDSEVPRQVLTLLYGLPAEHRHLAHVPIFPPGSGRKIVPLKISEHEISIEIQ